VPIAIDCGLCEDGKSSYTLLSWVEGNDAEKIVPLLSQEEQYCIGYKAGKELRQIHMNISLKCVMKDWYDTFWEVIAPRIEAYRQEGIPFDGAKEVLEFIENNKELLHNRPHKNVVKWFDKMQSEIPLWYSEYRKGNTKMTKLGGKLSE